MSKAMQPPEIILVDDKADSVSCDGGHGSLGHPVVWYSFDHSDVQECMYCDRAFVKRRAEDSYHAALKEQEKKSA